MQFIVNNKIYDTDKAELLAEGAKSFREESAFFGAISIFRETKLYKTRKGAFFFVYKGDYATHKIVVTNETEAKIFLMYKNYDKYVELYGELEEA